MTGTQFTLFAIGDWSSHKPELEALRSPLLEVLHISNQAAYLETGLSTGLYLVRPDGYIGLITQDVAKVHAYLSQTVGLTVA
jgi:hypothetical protein